MVDAIISCGSHTTGILVGETLLKLGGFMLLEEEANASGSDHDDEEMKIPPKEVVEEVAEELELQF